MINSAHEYRDIVIAPCPGGYSKHKQAVFMMYEHCSIEIWYVMTEHEIAASSQLCIPSLFNPIGNTSPGEGRIEVKEMRSTRRRKIGSHARLSKRFDLFAISFQS